MCSYTEVGTRQYFFTRQLHPDIGSPSRQASPRRMFWLFLQVIAVLHHRRRFHRFFVKCVWSRIRICLLCFNVHCPVYMSIFLSLQPTPCHAMIVIEELSRQPGPWRGCPTLQLPNRFFPFGVGMQFEVGRNYNWEKIRTGTKFEVGRNKSLDENRGGTKLELERN